MTNQPPFEDPLARVAELGGRALAAIFRATKLVRPNRPIHPRGVSLAGELSRNGSPLGGGSGLDWLDHPGVDTVEARFSRSVGFPPRVPDILGLALRIHSNRQDSEATEPADVLFASTGWTFPSRIVLLPRLNIGGATLTTLMPYRGKRGPVLLGLRTLQLPPHSGNVSDAEAQLSLDTGDWVLGLYFAKPAGRWIRAGELRLRTAEEGADTPLRFNPLEHPLPTARTYRWTERLREQSYRVAQRPANTASSSTTNERKPMSTVTKVFNSPAAEVWKVIANGWLYSGWVVGASRIRAVDAHWPEAGSRLHHSVGAWPLVIDDSTRVTAVEPGRSLELLARGWPVGEAKVAFTLEDQGTQCRVTLAEDAVRGPGKMVPKVLRDRLIGMRNRETLDRLELMAAGGAGN
ncbi:SRPBCC family protein [Arthrobacter sp. ISL-48]|uniref:SRPBCC family protein n=1 Tax=Arthrobacter sp. ISL-48 TaxID=2819110 RepID=UPI0020360B72|nr:SRPBCC family protein [Arthrobacter sp. ISL-48]